MQTYGMDQWEDQHKNIKLTKKNSENVIELIYLSIFYQTEERIEAVSFASENPGHAPPVESY